MCMRYAYPKTSILPISGRYGPPIVVAELLEDFVAITDYDGTTQCNQNVVSRFIKGSTAT